MNDIINTSLYLLAATAIVIAVLQSTNTTKLKFARMHLMLAAVVIVLKGAANGEAGIISSVLGAGIALLLTMLIIRSVDGDRVDTYIAVPIAALIGPFWTIVVFSISIFLALIQRWLGSESELVPQYFFAIDEDAATAIDLDERSALAEIEARKLLRTNSYSGDKQSGSPVGIQPAASAGSLMPWSFKLIIAAMIVLLYGVRT